MKNNSSAAAPGLVEAGKSKANEHAAQNMRLFIVAWNEPVKSVAAGYY